MIVLIDNYDSFSYNLYQLIGEVRSDICVIRNDEKTVEELRAMKPDAVILSPGPGRPEDAGICMEAAKTLGKEIPVLGVCLGHQAICEAFGGKVTYAKRLMHGKQSRAQLDTDSSLFLGMEPYALVARYHSLATDEASLPGELRVTARTDDKEVMAVEHTRYPIYGVQFHPESILTSNGKQIIENFLKIRNK